MSQTAAAKPGNKKGDPNETKRAKFERVAGGRVSNAIDKINLISKAANAQTYDFTKEDVSKIEDALREACKGVVESFDRALSGQKTGSAKTAFKF